MKDVYLAGPIAGLTYEEATKWRTDIAVRLRPHGCFDPLQGVSPWEGRLAGSTLEQSSLTTPRGIVASDFFFTTRARVLLADFSTAVRPSFGTVIECAWAWQARNPVVAILDSIHDHTMLRELCDFVVSDPDEAEFTIRKLLQ